MVKATLSSFHNRAGNVLGFVVVGQSTLVHVQLAHQGARLELTLLTSVNFILITAWKVCSLVFSRRSLSRNIGQVNVQNTYGAYFRPSMRDQFLAEVIGDKSH